ncbi:uncharacterized protein LOC106666990 [Cimex lectularius]|uniref:Uncharacterized protein n=1 Tax=Cimex lectularius TaxID=79782 RepID=A0A8I6SS55_CIMLE|nr:uncharacterized protein LOC106666990 [Cimex lectularius]
MEALTEVSDSNDQILAWVPEHPGRRGNKKVVINSSEAELVLKSLMLEEPNGIRIFTVYKLQVLAIIESRLRFDTSLLRKGDIQMGPGPESTTVTERCGRPSQLTTSDSRGSADSKDGGEI